MTSWSAWLIRKRSWQPSPMRRADLISVACPGRQCAARFDEVLQPGYLLVTDDFSVGNDIELESAEVVIAKVPASSAPLPGEAKISAING